MNEAFAPGQAKALGVSCVKCAQLRYRRLAKRSVEVLCEEERLLDEATADDEIAFSEAEPATLMFKNRILDRLLPEFLVVDRFASCRATSEKLAQIEVCLRYANEVGFDGGPVGWRYCIKNGRDEDEEHGARP